MALALGIGMAFSLGAAEAAGTTERVSVGPGSVEANEGSGGPAIAAGGRFVAFESFASNLVPGDTNGTADLFVRDRVAGTTERVSVGPGGIQANAASGGYEPTISSGGRFVAFLSSASNLVLGDTNRAQDVFVRDRVAGTTERVSVGTGGIQPNGMSAFSPAISAGGRFVAFVSGASNLVAGDTNGSFDVFVRDRTAGTTERVSVGPNGAQSDGSGNFPVISPGGRFVAFLSDARNLVAGDTNVAVDVFLHDRRIGRTERVNVGAGAAQADGSSLSPPAVSAFAHLVAFDSYASNLVPDDTNAARDVFVRDRVAGTTMRVSVGLGGAQANADSSSPAISAGGRFVAFLSEATNLVPGDTNGEPDVFLRDFRTGTIERVTIGRRGVQANGFSSRLAISPGGRFVAFSSLATNLVPGDTNDASDVFVRDRRNGTTDGSASVRAGRQPKS